VKSLITNYANVAVTTNAAQQGVFTIKANGKAFKILIDKLYANKIQSITREIWSNALDAHVMAGCANRPFDVSFPHVFDPTFRVRDYGISLTHEQVMTLYTTVFESTKEDTNTQVGKFGLGSKSPFAYTDTFTVSAVLNGEKRHYAAMIGSDGVPTINFMGSAPTDEENGVEVAFPVDKGDVAAFADAAKRVSLGFAVKPNVTNYKFEGWPTVNPIMEGKGWVILSEGMPGYRSTAYARMGCVLYPISVDALTGLTHLESTLLRSPAVIEFEMGELEMTASREELSYGRDEPTAASIMRRVAQVLDDITAIANVRYESKATHFEASVQHVEDVKSNLPTVFKEVLKERSTWRGQALKTEYLIPNRFAGMELYVMKRKELQRATQRWKKENNVSIEARPRTVIMIEDLTGIDKIKRAASRIKNYLTPSIQQVLWIKVWNMRKAQNDLLNLLQTFDGVMDVVDVSELPVPVSEWGGSGGTRRPVMARLLNSSGFENTVALDEDEFAEGGIYVPLERMIPVVPSGCYAPERMARALRAAGAIEANTPIYGIPKSMLKKVAGSQWVNLYEVAKEWVEDNPADVAGTYARKHAVRIVLEDDELDLLRRFADLSRCGSYSPVHEAVALREQASAEVIADVSPYVNVCDALGKAVENDAANDALADLYSELREVINERYPLLEYMGRVSYNDKAVDLVTDYVIMCDTAFGQKNQQAVRLAA
jgi:hypothetical protein